MIRVGVLIEGLIKELTPDIGLGIEMLESFKKLKSKVIII